MPTPVPGQGLHPDRGDDTPEAAKLFHEDDVGSGTPRGQRRRKTGRSSPHHENLTPESEILDEG